MMMENKLKVLFCYLAYPFAIASYFRQAFERRYDIDLQTMGAYTGDWLPWNNGMSLPYKYVRPVDFAFNRDIVNPSWEMAKRFAGDRFFVQPDIVVQVDAGWHFKNRPNVDCVITVATDPHVLDYSVPRGYSDYFFNMQQFYSQPGDRYLPYAADTYHHYPLITMPKTVDCCLIGLHYPQRDNLVNAIRSAGYTVQYDLGLIYGEYREANNQAMIGLNWSSLSDLPARVFEIMAMGLVCVTNRVPDLPLHFQEGKHYLAFDTVSEAVEKVRWVKEHPEEAAQIAQAGYEEVVFKHTYDLRVSRILATYVDNLH